MPFPDVATYEALVYSLSDRFAEVEGSTLVLAPIGRTLAKVEGQIMIGSGLVGTVARCNGLSERASWQHA